MHTHQKAIILIAVLIWQALSWVAPATVQQQAERLAHLVMHEEAVDHHHHHDESIHVQDMGNEAVHLHADGGNQPIGLTADKTLSPLTLNASPPQTAVCWLPSVCLDGPLRPPRASA